MQESGAGSKLKEVKDMRNKRMHKAAAERKAQAMAFVATALQVEADVVEGKAIKPKTKSSMVAHGMAWRRFVMHWNEGGGEAREEGEVDAQDGPKVEHAIMYASYMFRNRLSYSTTGLEGMSEAYMKQVWRAGGGTDRMNAIDVRLVLQAGFMLPLSWSSGHASYGYPRWKQMDAKERDTLALEFRSAIIKRWHEEVLRRTRDRIRPRRCRSGRDQILKTEAPQPFSITR